MSALSESSNRKASADGKSVSDSETDSDYNIPDGGYGWVVTFASFMCHFVADGIAFTFGVLYPDLLDYFGESKSKTSWIGSLFLGFPLLCAPIAGLFVNKYGCRVTTIIGGLITTVSLVISSFATSVDMLCVTFGFLAGFGLAFVYVPSSVIPSFWFEKRRALATGIAVSGSGVGTFAMAPLLQFLLEEYSWKGTMLIMAGLSLNIVVFGALFRPLPEEESLASSKPSNQPSECPSRLAASLNDVSQNDEETNLGQSFLEPKVCSVSLRRNSLDTIMQESQVDPLDLATLKLPGDSTLLDEGNLHQRIHHRRHHHFRGHLMHTGRHLLPLSLRDVSSVLALAEQRRERRRILSSVSCPNLSPSPFSFEAESKSKWLAILSGLQKLKQLSREMCDPALFRLPIYLLFFLSSFLFSFAYDIPYVYLVDYASAHGIEMASFLISIVGIVNTFGQVIYGFLGDKKRINVIILYGISILICGMFVCVVPLMTNYPSLATFAVVFGFVISANFSLETVVVIDILSLDELTKAYSLLLFGQGVASLTGPPTGGFLWDITQGYTCTFILAGVGLLISGVFTLVIPVIRRKEKSISETESRNMSV